jgi:Domain of unknown function (DUF4157)
MKQASPKQKVPTPLQPARQNGFVRKIQKPFFSSVTESPSLWMGPVDNSLEREAHAMAERTARRKDGDKSQVSVSQKTRLSITENENNLLGPDISPRISSVLHSPGRPLEDNIRRQMESFFKDSFSRIRIHDDRQAHESSALLRARAFTYGDHIVFAANAYQPDSVRGRKLIAHELTHTVQQEGGEELIQRDPDISIADQKEVKADFKKTIPKLETILVIHKKASPAIATFADKILLKNQQGNFTASFEAFIEKLANDKIVSSKADPEMDLLFDIYKQLGNHKEAAQLAKEKKYIPQKTAFYSADFYKEVLKDDLSWLPTHQVLSKYYPGPFLDTFLMYLYGPYIKVQSQDISALRTKQTEMISAIKSGSLVENERGYMAIEAFTLLDSGRKILMQTLDEWIKSGNALFRKVKVSSALIEINLDKVISVGYEETSSLLKTVIPRINKIVSDSMEFWKGIYEVAKQVDKNTFAASSIAIRFKKYKNEFKDFERLIVKAALTYLQLTWEGGMPGASEYDKQRKEAARQISLLIKNASLDLIRLRRSGERETSFLYGILVLYLDNAYSLLSPAGGKGTVQANDQIISRLNFGIAIGNLAALLSSAELSEIALEVKSPTGKRIFGGIQKETFIAFEKSLNWEQGELSASQSLKQYIDENTTITYSSSMAKLMEYFFTNASMQEEITKLKGTKELQNDSKAIEVDLMLATRDTYVPIPNRIQKSMDEMSRSEESVIPRRFVLHGAYFSAAPADQQNFSRIVFKNERFNQETELKFGYNGLIIAPMNVQTHLDAKGIVAWVISENSLIAFAASMMKLFPGVSIPINVNDQPGDWWNAFLAMVKDAESGKGPAGQKSAIPDLKQIESLTSKSLKETQVLLNFWRRKALSFHRRVMIRLVILPLWNAYKEDVSNISSWENPAKAIDQMIYLAGGHPYILDEHGNEELKMQIASAMLETGPIIYDKLLNQGFFGGAATSRLVMVGKLLPHVAGAISLEKEVAKDRNALLIGYPPEEHEGRVDRLKNLQKGLTEVLRSIYKSQVKDFIKLENGQLKIDRHDVGDWLQGNAGANELRDLNSTESFNPKTIIRSEQNSYSLLKVHKDFSYQPSVAIEAGGVKWDKDLLGDINPSVLIVRDNQGMHPLARKDRKGEILFTYQIIDKNAKPGNPIQVKDTDDVILKEIYSLIYVYSTNVNLGILADVLETGAEWLKLPLYLIPGAGEAIMAADLVVGVLQFITSPEFQTLKHIMMDGEGQELLDESIGQISSLFSAEGLWKALLDENFELPKFKDSETKTKSEDDVNQHSDGKLMKFLRSLMRIGKKILNGISWLKGTINYGLKRIHTFILNRPLLAAVISFVTNNYSFIASSAKRADRILNEGETIEDPPGFSEKINLLVGHLGELQVPLNLIPLDAVVDLIVRMAMKLLKGPKAVIAKSVKTVLEEAGIYSKILDLISDKLQGTKFDPNTYLNDFINAQVQPVVQKAGKFFVKEIGEVLTAVPELKAVTGLKAPEITKLEESGEDFESEPEVQPFGGPRFNLSGYFSLPAHPSNGQRLKQQQQNELEEEYNQDFSHVRLHTDADEVTSGIGAEALATGSHIYLRNGLSPETKTGQSVLKHELAHVIQQTGSRPIYEKHSDSPVDGRPGKGLIVDPAKEAEANQFSQQGDSGKIGMIQQPSHQHAEGVFPMASETALLFLQQVSKEPEEGKINLFAVKAPLTVSENRFAEQLPAKLSAALDKLKPASRLKVGLKEIKQYLKQKIDKSSKAEFLKIVREAKELKKEGKDPADTENWEFTKNRMELAVEEYLQHQTHVMTEVTMSSTGKGFKEIIANNIFLDKLDDTTLWEALMNNTFGQATKSKTIYKYDASKLQKYISATKDLIRQEGNRMPLASSGFMLTDRLAKRVQLLANTDPASLHTGTENDPIPIRWTKTGHHKHISLQAVKSPGWDPVNKDEFTASMNSQTKIEVPTAQVTAKSFEDMKPEKHNGKDHFFIKIGILDKFMYRIDKKIKRKDSGPRSMEGKFITLFSNYGYDWEITGNEGQDIVAQRGKKINKTSRYAPDHVLDLGLGGDDIIGDLWPLEGKYLNVEKGNQVYQQKVFYKEGQSVQEGPVMNLVGKWFIIKSIGDF